MPINLSNNLVLTSGVTVNGDYTSRIIRDGIRLYLDAANPNSYTGGTTTWVDLSGYGNNCVWGSAPTWNSAGGGCFVFNGSTNYGTVTMNSTLDTKYAQTVIIVSKRTSKTKNENMWNQAYGGYGTWVSLITSGQVYFYLGNSGTDSSPYEFITTTTDVGSDWVFLSSARALEPDNNIHRMLGYWNGVQISDQQIVNYGGPLTTCAANILIGDGLWSNFTGNIALVLMYNRRLQPYEIAETFQAVRGRYGL